MDASDEPPSADSGRVYTAGGVAFRLGGEITAAGVNAARREGRIFPCAEVVSGKGKVIYNFSSAELHRFARCREEYERHDAGRKSAFPRRNA